MDEFAPKAAPGQHAAAKRAAPAVRNAPVHAPRATPKIICLLILFSESLFALLHFTGANLPQRGGTA